MNKWRKQFDELEKEYHKKYDEYKNERNQCDSEIHKYRSQYNSWIATINSERSPIRQEIKKLYSFLKDFGDVGVQITHFDFQNEQMLPHIIDDTDNEENITFGHRKKEGINIGDMALLMIFPPIVFEKAGKYIFNWFKDKKNYLQKVEDTEREYTKWENQLKKCKDRVKFYKSAVEIAETFYQSFVTIIDSIRESIIPELNGITAFLVADAIKNCIIEGDNPDNAVPANISEYSGTLYDQHFIFVKNACDYYTLVKRFYTQPILTNIVEDSQVTDKERQQFLNAVKEINDKKTLLTENTIFGGSE